MKKQLTALINFTQAEVDKYSYENWTENVYDCNLSVLKRPLENTTKIIFSENCHSEFINKIITLLICESVQGNLYHQEIATNYCISSEKKIVNIFTIQNGNYKLDENIMKTKGFNSLQILFYHAFGQ